MNKMIFLLFKNTQPMLHLLFSLPPKKVSRSAPSKYRRALYLALCLIFIFNLSEAQEVELNQEARTFTLHDIVQLALDRSPFALQAQTRRENRYWYWRSYKSQYMPRLYLNGTLPDFTRSNTPVQQPDGSYEFRPVSQNLSRLNMGIQQSIGFTNTTIFMQ